MIVILTSNNESYIIEEFNTNNIDIIKEAYYSNQYLSSEKSFDDFLHFDNNLNSLVRIKTRFFPYGILLLTELSFEKNEQNDHFIAKCFLYSTINDDFIGEILIKSPENIRYIRGDISKISNVIKK